MDHRRRKRLFARLAKAYSAAVRRVDRLDTLTWFDLWHTHIDWESIGNRHPECRAEVARLTYALLWHVEKHFSERSEPVQIFATICEETGNNAVWVHSANPHGNQFPYIFPNPIWRAAPPSELDDVVDQVRHEIGKVRYEVETQHVIRRRAG